MKNKRTKIFIICLALAVSMGVSATSCSTNQDSAWKQARVLNLSEKEEILPYYKSFVAGDEQMLDEEYEALKAYEQLHPEEYRKMNYPLILKLEDESEAFIIYTDNEGNVKTSKGETLGTID